MDINNLLIEIAVCRCQMNKFSKGKRPTDPDVIKLSQGLDISIYKYVEALRQQNFEMSERDQQ
ncbi:MAG: hypothetical protein APF81_19370 [Desulfosporosinus sp. BRH_c37]|nr:MAG: hypothetical protein APF81_19370 [Desulfosporosinus sp. BRH_c37]